MTIRDHTLTAMAIHIWSLVMSRTESILVGVVVAVVIGVWLVTDPEEPSVIGTVVNWITRGRRLTTTTLNANGDVDVDPFALAQTASAVVGRSVSIDDYALARMLDSEEPSASHNTKLAIAWVAVNEARRRGVSVADLLLTDNGPGDGLFGEQKGRYASTRSDPYEGALQIAQSVLSGENPDQTGGAIHFYRPKLQDVLFAKGKVRLTAAQVDANWGGNGFTVPGVDNDIRFYT